MTAPETLGLLALVAMACPFSFAPGVVVANRWR